jgi:hypothetical protein
MRTPKTPKSASWFSPAFPFQSAAQRRQHGRSQARAGGRWLTAALSLTLPWAVAGCGDGTTEMPAMMMPMEPQEAALAPCSAALPMPTTLTEKSPASICISVAPGESAPGTMALLDGTTLTLPEYTTVGAPVQLSMSGPSDVGALTSCCRSTGASCQPPRAPSAIAWSCCPSLAMPRRM